MGTQIGAYARELEVLIARAVRAGDLDVTELLDTYASLQPASHPGLADARRFDLTAVVAALSRLPVELWSAPRVEVVPDLSGFSVTPHQSAGLAAGSLDDGTLLLEARFGWVSIVGLVAQLCALAVERNKALELLTPLANAASDDQSVVEPAFAKVALYLGVEERALLAAARDTGGALLLLLNQELAFPVLGFHPELQPRVLEERATARGRVIAATLAEAGLAQRPLHVWVGNRVLTDCVSPYPRELREALLAWATATPQGLGEDLRDQHDAPGEDVIYALAHDLVGATPALEEEREAADRTVGIQHRELDGLRYEIIDVARLDAGLCDARLHHLDASDRPVLLRLPPGLSDPTGCALAELLRTLGSSVASVTFVLEGTLLDAGVGEVAAPGLLVTWAGDETVIVPGLASLDPDALVTFTGREPRAGAVLSVPSASLVSAAHLEELTRKLGVSSVEVGSQGLVRALAEAQWARHLPPTARVWLALVGAQTVSTGRCSLATLRGVSAVALTLLRSLGEPGPGAQAAPDVAEREPPRATRPGGRAMRIKA